MYTARPGTTEADEIDTRLVSNTWAGQNTEARMPTRLAQGCRGDTHCLLDAEHPSAETNARAV